MRLQPNCSELIFWLNEVESDVEPEEILLAAERELPILNVTEPGASDLEFFVFSTLEDKRKAEALKAECASSETLWDRLVAQGIYPASLRLEKRRGAISYSQHSQPQGYPVLAWLEEKLGIQVKEDYSGGSLEHYREWKEKHAA